MSIGYGKGAKYPIARVKIHDWAEYGPSLSEHGLVRSLLEGTLRSWVENERLSNPLAIPWVYLVRNHQAHYVCQELSKWLDAPYALGILPRMLQELGQQRSSAEAAKKIASLRGEAAVYRLLRTSGYPIDWVQDAADWQVGDRLISVKTKLPLQHGYEVAAQAIRAASGIVENQHCQQIRSVHLEKMNQLTDKNLAHVLSIIDQQLEVILEHWVDLHEQHGQVLGRYEFFEMKPSSLDIVIAAPDDPKKSIGEIVLEMDSTSDNSLYINHDMNAYWTEPLDLLWVRARVSEKLNEVKTANTRCQDKIEAWVNLIIHPRNEKWIRDNLAILHRQISAVAEDYDFPVTVCLYPQWGCILKQLLLWTYQSGIGETLTRVP